MASFLALANALNSLTSRLEAWEKAATGDETSQQNQHAKEFTGDVLRELKLVRTDGTYTLNESDGALLEKCRDAADGIHSLLQAYGGGIGRPRVGIPSGMNTPTPQSLIDLYEMRKRALREVERWAMGRHSGLYQLLPQDIQRHEGHRSVVDPRINLLPLTDPQKAIFSSAVRLVLGGSKNFADATRWLEEDYSVDAYRKRHDHEWAVSLMERERAAKCAPSVEELASKRGDGNGHSPATSWHSRNDEKGNTICDENGDTKYFFDKDRDDKRRAEAEKFDPKTFKRVMKERDLELAEIQRERRKGRPVGQVERLRLAMSDLAAQEMEIGGAAESHSRKLVLVAYLLVWHETRKGLGEFGRWAWDGAALWGGEALDEQAKRPKASPPGRDRVLFEWFGFDNRKVDYAVEDVLDGFTKKLEMAIPLLPALDIAAETSKAVHSADNPATVALTANEQAFLDALNDEGQSGPDIVAVLHRGGIQKIGEVEISKMWKLPHLKARGVRHRKGAGYYRVKDNAKMDPS